MVYVLFSFIIDIYQKQNLFNSITECNFEDPWNEDYHCFMMKYAYSIKAPDIVFEAENMNSYTRD